MGNIVEALMGETHAVVVAKKPLTLAKRFPGNSLMDWYCHKYYCGDDVRLNAWELEQIGRHFTESVLAIELQCDHMTDDEWMDSQQRKEMARLGGEFQAIQDFYNSQRF